jgi:hypothetical protein
LEVLRSVRCESRSEHGLLSESQCRQGPRSVDVCRDANLSPAFCIGCTSRLGFASLPNGVAAQQEMGGQAITGSRTKDDLSHSGRIAILLAPERLQRLGYRAHGRFIIREQLRCFFVGTSAPVRPHSAGFERTHVDAKGATSWARASVNPQQPTWQLGTQRCREAPSDRPLTISEGCSRSFAFS